MPVYRYNGEQVEAVQWTKYDDHVFTRQLHAGEFAADVPDKDVRRTCAALDQPPEAPRLVRPGDVVITRRGEHGDLTCEIVSPGSDFLAAAEYVGTVDPALAGIASSPEHAQRIATDVQADLDRQERARKRRGEEVEESRRRDEKADAERRERSAASRREQERANAPARQEAERRGAEAGRAPKPEAEPVGEGREATPQPAGADGHRSRKADEPDPDAARHQPHKARVR